MQCVPHETRRDKTKGQCRISKIIKYESIDCSQQGYKNKKMGAPAPASRPCTAAWARIPIKFPCGREIQHMFSVSFVDHYGWAEISTRFDALIRCIAAMCKSLYICMCMCAYDSNCRHSCHTFVHSWKDVKFRLFVTILIVKCQRECDKRANMGVYKRSRMRRESENCDNWCWKCYRLV